MTVIRDFIPIDGFGLMVLITLSCSKETITDELTSVKMKACIYW